MNFVGEKVNIALQVKAYARIDPRTAVYSGIALAPTHLRGKAIKVHLTQYHAWKVADMESADSMLGYVERLGFRDLKQFSDDVDERFTVMREEGTIALFQSCMVADSSPDTWGSWVGDAVGVRPPHDVLHGLARVNIKEFPGAAAKVNVDFLHPEQARFIRTAKDFRAFFEEFVGPVDRQGNENNANCLFRVSTGGTDKKVCFWLFCAREEVCYRDGGGRERRFSIPADVDVTWDSAVVRGEQSGGLCRVIAKALGVDVDVSRDDHLQLAYEIRSGLENSTVTIEAIPGQRHRMISEDFADRNSVMMRKLREQVQRCAVKVGAKEERGFFPMIAVVSKSVPASARYVPKQHGAVVISRVYHDEVEHGKFPVLADEIDLEWGL